MIGSIEFFLRLAFITPTSVFGSGSPKFWRNRSCCYARNADKTFLIKAFLSSPPALKAADKVTNPCAGHRRAGGSLLSVWWGDGVSLVGGAAGVNAKAEVTGGL